MKLTPRQIAEIENYPDESSENVKSLLAHIRDIEAERDAAVKGLRKVIAKSDCPIADDIATEALKSAGAEP